MSFVVYSSSAGSGKTYTLVKEYIRLALITKYDFRRILAITFTNKAANEMKSRVMEYLRCLSEPQKYPESTAVKYLMPELVSEMNISEDEICKEAGNVLKIILHNYVDFAISTIDSFVYRIVKTFSFDINLPLDFEVETDTDRLIEQSIDLLISEAGVNRELTRWIVRYVESRADEENSWHIERELANYSNILLDDESQEYVGRLKSVSLEHFEELNNKIQKDIKVFENNLARIGGEAVKLLEQHAISFKSFFYNNRSPLKYFERFMKREFHKGIPASKGLTDLVNREDWSAKNAPANDKSKIAELRPVWLRLYNEIEKAIDRGHTRYEFYKLLAKNIYQMALLSEIERIMIDFKSKNRIVLISEFNKKIADIVLNEPVPFIYERIGEKYRHFLIDEFQDTSVLQWQNLLPLIDNSLSMGNFNMIVGDGKQSIYRWRNGDVEQFAKLPAIHKPGKNPYNAEREVTLRNNFIPRKLDNNFRSAPALIDFNNEFFRIIKQLIPDMLGNIYSDHMQNIPEGKTGGFVSLEFFNKEQNDDDFGDFNCHKALEYINESRKAGYALKDIAVLCRKRDQTSEIARYLIENKIDVISSESLLLKNSYDVQFIIHFMQYLYAPTNILFVAIVRYLFFRGILKGDSFSDLILSYLPGKQKSEFDPDLLYKLFDDFGIGISKSRLYKLPPYDLVEETIRIFKLNKGVDPFLHFFLDAVLNFTIRRQRGILEFFEWWETESEKLSIVIPEGIDAVQIMTIHKAKGLEFPIVIYPYANEKKSLTKKMLWIDLQDNHDVPIDIALVKYFSGMVDAGLEEPYTEEDHKSFLDLVNLLYVVMTRASERLYIISEWPKSKPNDYNNSSKLFYYFLEQTGKINPEIFTYHYGQKTDKIVREKAEIDINCSFLSYVSNDWRDRVLLSTMAPDSWDVLNPERNRQWGNLVHTVLSRIKVSDDLEPVLEEMLLQGVLSAEERAEIKPLIETMFGSEKVISLFSSDNNIKAEAEIILPDGKSYRPDRLILNKDKTIVVDYKTGRFDDKHIAQIKKYAELLQQMGYTNIKRYLLYVDQEPELLEV